MFSSYSLTFRRSSDFFPGFLPFGTFFHTTSSTTSSTVSNSSSTFFAAAFLLLALAAGLDFGGSYGFGITFT